MNPPSTPPKLLHATRWLSLYERDGWIYASRRPAGAPRRHDALSIAAFHEEEQAGQVRRRLVVIEEWRVPVQAWEFSFCAGLVEEGEALATCAERELAEETGLKMTWIASESGMMFSSPGMSDETIAMMMVGCSGVPSENPGVDGERIRVHLLDRAGCRSLLARNQSGDALLSVRLWPILYSIAETGVFAGKSVA